MEISILILNSDRNVKEKSDEIRISILAIHTGSATSQSSGTVPPALCIESLSFSGEIQLVGLLTYL